MSCRPSRRGKRVAYGICSGCFPLLFAVFLPGLSNPHEYSYCDDANEVLCRLEVRQVEKTKVTENARNIFYIVQGNAATPDTLLQDTAGRIIELTNKYCGGTGEIIIPKAVRISEHE